MPVKVLLRLAQSLTAMLAGLKLFGYIDCLWVWVFSPFWLPVVGVALAFTLWAAVIVCTFLMVFFK